MAALDIPFNMNQFAQQEKYAEFKMKLVTGDFPLTNLPMIKDPNNADCYRSETNAVLMYLAQKYRPDAAPTMKELSDFMAHQGMIDDLASAFIMPNYSSPDLETFKKHVMDRKDRQKSKFMYIANMLSKSGWFFRGRFTYLDVGLAYYAEIILNWEKDLKVEYLEEGVRKVLSAHRDKVYEIEGIKKWRSSEKFVERPFFFPGLAQWG